MVKYFSLNIKKIVTLSNKYPNHKFKKTKILHSIFNKKQMQCNLLRVNTFWKFYRNSKVFYLCNLDN